jgi:hypothetical protein
MAFFLAPLLSAAGTFFASKVGTAVATTAVSAAVGAINQKSQNKAANAAYNKMLSEQEAERNRIATQNDLDRKYQAKIDEQNRITAKADAANKFVDMNAAAQKAGLNPLTVLRATGGSGFGAYGGYGAVLQGAVTQPTIQAPILSSQSVAQQIGLGALQGFIDFKTNQTANEHYDRLNELDLEQRKINIKLGKAQLDSINKPNVYDAYGDYIPVRVGDNVQQLEKTVAIRMGISPNDMLTVEDLQMIKGDVLAETEALAANKIRDRVLIPAPLGGSDSDTWFNNFVGMATNAINSVQGNYVNTPPFSNPGWSKEWRNYVN